VRRVAAEGLGQSRDQHAFAPLIAALADHNLWVCRVAIKALGYVGDTRAVEPLIAFYEKISFDITMRIVTGGYNSLLRVFPAWQSLEALLDYAREHCAVRELTDAERELFGLPQR
jgi:HEAT repeat protein